MLTRRGSLNRSGSKWDLVGNVGLRGFFGGNRNDGVWRRRFVPKHFSNVFCGLPKPATRVFPHKRCSLRESWCRLNVFVAGVMFAWSQSEGGQSWLFQGLAAEMLTGRRDMKRSQSKWD
jgi:hypothetical protein